MGVFGVKGGTKAFGEIDPGVQGAPVSKNLSAQDFAKMGGEDVGEVLNKLADPNHIDASKKMRTVGNDKLDKDAFFKLMITQLKNQDPSNPLKSHEMAAQLASFSSLEQMTNINATLTELKNGQKPMEQYEALNLIGKAISGDSSKVVRMATDKAHDVQFDLPMDAQDLKIRVRGPDGSTVRNLNLTNLKKGLNKVSWNGQDEKGAATPAGDYQFLLEGKTAEGKKIAIETSFDGVISGVNYTSEGPVLVVGNKTVKMSEVKKIVDPRILGEDRKMVQEVKEDLKEQPASGENKETSSQKTEVKPETKTGASAAVDQDGTHQNIFKDVGLSQEMLAKLSKEVAP